MGRELFDYAFKEYARRWAFKHPTPADFFRTLEDASAVDLDWFWRGWFFSIDPVDISLDDVQHFQPMGNLQDAQTTAKAAFENDLNTVSRQRNIDEGVNFAVEADTALQDFYNKWDRFEIAEEDKRAFKQYYESLSSDEKALYDGKYHFYQLKFSNKGGLVMPIILQWTFADGTTEIERIPAYIWRKNESEVTKVFAKTKEVTAVLVDPLRETGDIDEGNNAWPRTHTPTRFQLFKQQQGPARGASTGPNPMQRAKRSGQ